MEVWERPGPLAPVTLSLEGSRSVTIALRGSFNAGQLKQPAPDYCGRFHRQHDLPPHGNREANDGSDDDNGVIDIISRSAALDVQMLSVVVVCCSP